MQSLQFSTCGLSFSTWATRIPTAQATLGLDHSGLARVLFTISAGAILGLVLAPAIGAWLGARRGLLLMGGGFALGLSLAGVGVALHALEAAMAALAFFGFCFACTDVLMNVEAAEVEKRIGKTVMPLMHGFYSFGTISGALLGTLLVRLHVPVVIHFIGMTLLMALVVTASVWLLPAREPIVRDSRTVRTRISEMLGAWRDIRLLLIGLLVLGMAFAEGAAGEWVAVASIKGHGMSETIGVLAYATFVAAMTLGRVTGGPLIDRYGRMATLATLAIIGIGGLLMYIYAAGVATLFAGVALWGIGASLGFPVGISAAADHPDAARRVSVVGLFGYGAFLICSPLVGVLGKHYGILTAFYSVVALLFLSLLMTPATRVAVQQEAVSPVPLPLPPAREPMFSQGSQDSR